MYASSEIRVQHARLGGVSSSSPFPAIRPRQHRQSRRELKSKDYRRGLSKIPNAVDEVGWQGPRLWDLVATDSSVSGVQHFDRQDLTGLWAYRLFWNAPGWERQRCAPPGHGVDWLY